MTDIQTDRQTYRQTHCNISKLLNPLVFIVQLVHCSSTLISGRSEVSTEGGEGGEGESTATLLQIKMEV